MSDSVPELSAINFTALLNLLHPPLLLIVIAATGNAIMINPIANLRYSVPLLQLVLGPLLPPLLHLEGILDGLPLRTCL